MRIGGEARGIDRLAASPLVSLEIVGNHEGDGHRAIWRVVSFLPTTFDAPPLASRFLRVAIIKNGYSIGILKIVGGADPVLGITTVTLPPPGQPRTAAGTPAVAERESPFEAAPIRFAADWKPQPSGSGFKICVANCASYFASL